MLSPKEVLISNTKILGERGTRNDAPKMLMGRGLYMPAPAEGLSEVRQHSPRHPLWRWLMEGSVPETFRRKKKGGGEPTMQANATLMSFLDWGELPPTMFHN